MEQVNFQEKSPKILDDILTLSRNWKYRKLQNIVFRLKGLAVEFPNRAKLQPLNGIQPILVIWLRNEKINPHRLVSGYTENSNWYFRMNRSTPGLILNVCIFTYQPHLHCTSKARGVRTRVSQLGPVDELSSRSMVWTTVNTVGDTTWWWWTTRQVRGEGTVRASQGEGQSGGGAVRRRDSQEEGQSGGKDSQRIRALVRNLECFLLNIMIFLLIITIKNSSFIQLCCEQVFFIVQVSFHCPSRSQSMQVRTRGGGGALGARAPPSPTWERSSVQKCPKEERNFRPDISAKNNVHVPLRYHKIKTKKLGKKEENNERKGLKLKK